MNYIYSTLFFQFGYNFVTLLDAAGIKSAESADASHVLDVIGVTFRHIHQTVHKLLACWEGKLTVLHKSLSFRDGIRNCTRCLNDAQ